MKIKFTTFLVVCSLCYIGVTAQTAHIIYALAINEQPEEKNLLHIEGYDIIKLPFGCNEEVTYHASQNNTILLSTSSKDGNKSSLWLYDYRAASLKPLLNINMHIQSCALLEEGYECILKEGAKSYLIRRRPQDKKIHGKEIQNDLKKILAQDMYPRYTSDATRQLSSTDSSYTRFKILSNNTLIPIAFSDSGKVYYIYELRKDYRLLKLYDRDQDRHSGVKKMPDGVENFHITDAQNFISYNTQKIFTYNPQSDFDWKELSLPPDIVIGQIHWLTILGGNKLLIYTRQ